MRRERLLNFLLPVMMVEPAVAHFTLDVGMAALNGSQVVTHTVIDGDGMIRRTFIVDPGQRLEMACEVTNDSDIRSLSSHRGIDSELGELPIPPGVLTAPRAVFELAVPRTAPALTGTYERSLSWSAFSSNGVLHQRPANYALRVREIDIQLVFGHPSLIPAQAGEEIAIEIIASADDMSAPFTMWSVTDAMAGELGRGDGTPFRADERRTFDYTVRAPPVAGSFVVPVVFPAADEFGNTDWTEGAYTIEVPGTDFDPDQDGMHNEYEVRHGLNPLVHDAFTDLDRDGGSNLAESLFGTGANDPSSRAEPSVEPVASGVVRVRWPSVPGNRYRLEAGPNLQTWAEVQTITATQPETAVDLPVDAEAVYFRVVASKP